MTDLFCACGCGKTLELYDNWGRTRKFIHGHNARGALASNYKGARQISDGYIRINRPSHHFANRRGMVYEHRIVWEEYNKASLLPWGYIHHKNKIKTDNRIENLEAMMDWRHGIIHRHDANHHS